MSTDIQKRATLSLGGVKQSPAPQAPVAVPPAPAATAPVAPVSTVGYHQLDWHPIDDKAKTGDFVYLRPPSPGDVPEEWYWYKSREFREGSWQQTAWWKRRFGSADPCRFEPTGYRRVGEGLA